MGWEALMTPPLGFIVDGEMNTWPADRVIEVLAGAGAQSIDWGTAHFDSLSDKPNVLVDLVARSKLAGLNVGQLVVAEDFVTLDSEAWQRRVLRTKRAIDACAEAGIGSIDVITGPQRWNPDALRVGVDLSESQAWDLAFRALESVLGHASKTTVKVSLEPVWGTLARSAYRADYALTKLQHPSLGLTVDPSHFVLTSDDMAAFVRRWQGIVTHVHLKDAAGQEGTQDRDFVFLMPGEGLVDWPQFFHEISAARYEGPFTIEFESNPLLRHVLGGSWAAAAKLSLSLAQRLVHGSGAGASELALKELG
jgi:sugar phosphate isomerase/epimerase